MKLNLNIKVVDLDGKEIPDANLGKIIARDLFFSSEKDNALKFFEWAQKLHIGEPIDLDTQDHATFTNFINQANYPVVTRIAIISAIKNSK